MNRRSTAIFAAGMCSFVNLYAPQSLLPTLADAFDAPASRTGLTMTATLVAVAGVAPFVGVISDAFGRRRLIVPASLGLVVPTALAGLATGLDGLLAWRFVQGLLLPFIFAVTVAYIADECEGAERVRATGIYSMGSIIGGFLGRFVAGWGAHFLGWRASFLILAAITLGLASIMAVFLPVERRFRPVRSWRRTMEGFVGQFGNRQVMATCLVGFAVLFSIVATFTYANLLLAAAPYRLGPAELGSIFVSYLLGAVVTPPATRLTLRLGRRRTVLVAGGVAAAGLLLTLTPSLWAIVAGLSLLAIGIFTEQMLSIGYVAIAGERARSTAVGLYVTSYYLGGSLGGIAPAWIWSHLGWPGCVSLVLAVQAVALGVAVRTWPGRTALS
ncbi:MAG: MFS transporter [Pseudomonadota bacterium]|nr:MFS transporter [Pseudomonadota bacterium]